MEVITTHVNSDFDCLGAMIAAKKLYPEAEMVFAGSQERSLREFFLKSAYYAHSFKRVRDIDLAAVTRLILVDVRQASRIGAFGPVALRPEVDVHIYDHHPDVPGALQGSVQVIRPVGATVTILTHLFMEKGIDPTPDEATMMMLGLYEDTGSLLFSSTTEEDYQAAAFLLKRGASLSTVADFLIQELTADQVALLHELINSSFLLNINGVDITLAHASVDHFVPDIAVLAHKLKDMQRLDVLIIAVRMEGRIFLVGRSRISEAPVGEILAELGGGGHAYAASGTVRDMTLVQVLDALPDILRRHVNPRWEARHLMSYPVKTISEDATIDDVRRTLTRYGLNALPVVRGEAVVGIITRHVVERAAHHRLANVLVKEYMSGDFSTVSPQATVDALKDLIVERNQRFVPVIDRGALVGAITRTDLLRHMVSGVRSARLPEIGLGPDDSGQGMRRRHVERLIKLRLPEPILKVMKDCGTVGDELGMPVYAVGGFVRDLLLEMENLDLDVVVEGDGIAFALAFAKRYPCRVREHRKFGTAVLIFPDGFKLDVASARMEYYLEPGALPTVEHSSIKLDLFRRDFTINTLALALSPGEFGELRDFFGAQRDMHDKVLRVLHNLSFVEDPTRVFRAVRFEQRLGFQLGTHTEHLLRSAVRMGFLDRVKGTRLFNELRIIFEEAHPLPAVFRLAELDLLKYIHPALSLGAKKRANFEAASHAVQWYRFIYIGDTFQCWQVYLLCLFSDLDDEALESLCGRLEIPNRYQTLLFDQRKRAHYTLTRMHRALRRKNPPRPSELYHWLHDFSTELLVYMMACSRQEKVRRWISRYFSHLRLASCQLSGHDLKELGIAPGPAFREILDRLLMARLDGEVATAEDEIELVKKRYLPAR